MSTISIHTERHLHNGVVTVSLIGELTYEGVPAVRNALLKCASECPSGIIVELSGLVRAAAATVNVFATASHRAQIDWGVPVLLSGPSDDVAQVLAPFGMFTTVCRDHRTALAALRGWAPHWVHERMRNTPASVPRAVSLVGDACLAWALPEIRTPARLVMSELVSNAVEHTDADPVVMVSFTGMYLRLAVQDSSRTLPRLIPDVVDADVVQPSRPRGHGLRIVRDTASHWGITPVPGGKAVWALLRAHVPPLAG